jgi:hypothetical protein
MKCSKEPLFVLTVSEDYLLSTRSRDSTVGITTDYDLDSQGVGLRVPVGSRIFSPPRCSGRFWGHPASNAMGIGDYFLGGKAAGT